MNPITPQKTERQPVDLTQDEVNQCLLQAQDDFNKVSA